MTKSLAVRRIVNSFPVKPHYLILEFEPGEYRSLDLADLVKRAGSLFEPLRNWEFFRMVSVRNEDGTVVWPNGLDLDPEELYDLGQPQS